MKQLKLLKLASILCGLLIVSGVQAATVAVSAPSLGTINVGDTFTVTIDGSGFIGVDGGGIDLAYDAAALQYNGATLDAAFWNVSAITGTESTGFVATIYGATFFSGTTTFTLATLSFTALAVGTSLLDISHATTGTWSDAGSTIVPTFTDGSITVSAIPLPAAFWLLGAGLIGLVGVARRRAA